MKKFMVFSLALALTGCGYFERMTATVTGYSTICVKETGVMYVQGTSGLARLDDKNGHPVPCR